MDISSESVGEDIARKSLGANTSVGGEWNGNDEGPTIIVDSLFKGIQHPLIARSL